MKDVKIPSHQIDVVEIMKKIRQSASGNRTELTRDDRIKREAKSEFQTLIQNAQVPDSVADLIKQQTFFEPYDPRTLYVSKRPGIGTILGVIRRLLKPITKLFVNLDPLAYEVHRLTALNNLYLKAIQDLVYKTSALQVEMYHFKKRSGGGRHRPEHSRYNNSGSNHRRHRDRQHRRESGDNRNAQPARIHSAVEPPSQ
ncbi:hypothetical protein L0222_11710 [bacterium]|nr:hypothetical protein [bacterium]MCI0605780.1 hypothetical protein [bacterium]